MRDKRKEWMGVIGTLGLVPVLLSILGQVIPLGLGLALGVSIWSVGATLVIVFTDPPNGG